MVYISIESRKGGVGKTTTALTLAENLLDKGYHVLMVDMDIIGTTIDPTFINAHQDTIHEVKLNDKAVNMVRLFKDVYMAGKNIPAFAQVEDNNGKAFTFSLGKCNFIGSNIYDKPKETNGEPEVTTPLEDPRILYDAYHAYWLLEFVKGIAESFATAMAENEKVVVILDNSPGFSSLENCIHDYLTDLGPEGGKILLVSTIDPQDIEACRQSKSIIEKRFNDKVEAGIYYRSLSEGQPRKKIQSADFDIVWDRLCASDGRQPKYHSCAHNEAKPFVNILVNKVPQDIFEKLFDNGVLHRDSENATPFQNHLLYYFSNPQLSSYEISHQRSYAERITEFRQSGKVNEIEHDDARYLRYCDFAKQIGMGEFFKKEWAPKAIFMELKNLLENDGMLKDQPKQNISILKGSFVNYENRIEDAVNTVSRFVIDNLRPESHLNDIIPLVKANVTSELRGFEDNALIDFHPDHPRLQEKEYFVTAFSLAAYRLHIYEQICKMFNILMIHCLDNNENIEMLNKNSVSNWIENVLDGRVPKQDLAATMEHMLNDRKNARELSNVLQEIIHSWEL